MRPKKIMIILPPTLKGPGMVMSPPLDIANLVAILREGGHDRILLSDLRRNVLDHSGLYSKKGADLGLFNDLSKCLRYFVRGDRDVERTVDLILADVNVEGAGYAVFSVAVLEQFSLPYLMASLCMAKRIKDRSPDMKVVLFGNCPKKHIRKIMELFKFVDAFPSGGNEFAVVDYIERHAAAGPIDGVTCRNGKKLMAPGKDRAMALDRFPLPDFSMFDLDRYRVRGRLVLPYELSRGCCNACFYCYYIHKGSIHLKAPGKAVSDLMALARKYRTGLFHFMDAAINADPVWLAGVCGLLSRQPVKIKWSALAVPNMSVTLLDKLHKAGCVQLRWGVESGSAKMLKRINKGITKASVKRTLAAAHDRGFNNYITLISGLDGETADDVSETKDFIREIAPSVDSAKECVYGELGHFSLAVFEALVAGEARVRPRVAQYGSVLAESGVGEEDIIDFMAGQPACTGRT